MTQRLETLEHHALNFDQPEILATPHCNSYPYCGGHPLLWQSPLIVAVTPYCEPRPIVITRQQPPHLRKNYRSPIFFGSTLHPNTTTITYEIAELANNAVMCSGSKCCLVNSLFVLACASLTKIQPVTMIAMRKSDEEWPAS